MAQDTYSLDSYFGHSKVFTTDSPFLISSSQFLNDPVARDHFVTSSFRKNHPELPTYVDNTRTVPICNDYFRRNGAEIEALITAERKKNPALDAYFAAGRFEDLSMARLSKCPKGSVGDILFRFCDSNGYASVLGAVDGPPPKSQMEFFLRRIGYTHDLEHILGGFGFDYIGEQGAVWIRHASYFQHLSAELAGHLNVSYVFIMMPMLTRTMLNYPQTQTVLWDVINDAMTIGRTSDPIYMMNYDEALDLSIPEARDALGWRNCVDRDSREAGDIWSEGVPLALDPRRGEDLAVAEAKLKAVA